MFRDKILLITGGTGSFGNAVLNQFLNTDIKEIRIFSRDEKKQEEIEIRNNADSMIYTAEKTINEKEMQDKVQADEKENIEKLVKELRELISGEDLEAIKAKTDELSDVVQKIGARIYQEAAAAQQAAQGGADPNAGAGFGADPNAGAQEEDDGTIDAEFEEKK